MRLLRGQFELRVADCGARALAAVQGWSPDVLILDANLPDMSGFEVLRPLRALPALHSVPAFICSADALASDLQRARDAGFDGYRTKPIAAAAVLAELDAVARQVSMPA